MPRRRPSSSAVTGRSLRCAVALLDCRRPVLPWAVMAGPLRVPADRATRGGSERGWGCGSWWGCDSWELCRTRSCASGCVRDRSGRTRSIPHTGVGAAACAGFASRPVGGVREKSPPAQAIAHTPRDPAPGAVAPRTGTTEAAAVSPRIGAPPPSHSSPPVGGTPRVPPSPPTARRDAGSQATQPTPTDTTPRRRRLTAGAAARYLTSANAPGSRAPALSPATSPARPPPTCDWRACARS